MLHMGLSCIPASSLAALIWSASLYRLFNQLLSFSSHLMLWSVLFACTAIPLAWSIPTALLCSFTLVSSVLPVLLLPQLQSILYTTPFTLSLSGLLFTQVRRLRSVLFAVNTVLMLRLISQCSRSSLGCTVSIGSRFRVGVAGAVKGDIGLPSGQAPSGQMCRVMVTSEDTMKMAEFGLHLAWMANCSGSMSKTFDNAHFNARMVVGSEIQIAVGVCRYTDVVRPSHPLWTSTSQRGFFCFHGKLDAWGERVEVGEKVVERVAAMWPARFALKWPQ